MDPSKPSPQSRKKHAASGAANWDSANEKMHHNLVGGSLSRDRDSHTRVPAAEKKGREHLNDWNCPRMAERLLLDIQYECARNNVDLPWDRIAHRMSPGSSSSALHRYLWRTRQQLIAEGHTVPPQVGLGGRRAANNGLDARGFVRNSEESADLTTTGAAGWNDFHGRRLNLADASNAPVVETSKDRKAVKTEFSDDESSPEADDCTTAAFQSRRSAFKKNTCANSESGEDEDEVKVDDENPFDDRYEYKEEAAQDGGDATVGAMEGTDCNQMQLSDTVSQVGTFAVDNAAAATAHSRARQLYVAQQANSQPYDSLFEAAQPRLASMDGPMLVSYDGGLSFRPAHTHSITEWSSSYTVYSGAAAAQLAADLGYGQTVQTLFSQAIDNPSGFGSDAPSQSLRSENPTGAQEESPTPTTRNHRFGAAENKSAALPTTSTPKREQHSGRSFMSSFEADEAVSTPRATASSSSRGASGTASTASVEPSRPFSSNTVDSAAMQGNLDNRWNDDDDISNAFPGIGLGGPGKSSPETEDEDES